MPKQEDTELDINKLIPEIRVIKWGLLIVIIILTLLIIILNNRITKNNNHPISVPIDARQDRSRVHPNGI
jgi:hypothetical protein